VTLQRTPPLVVDADAAIHTQTEPIGPNWDNIRTTLVTASGGSHYEGDSKTTTQLVLTPDLCSYLNPRLLPGTGRCNRHSAHRRLNRQTSESALSRSPIGSGAASSSIE
jgi:hypothetical protein